VTKVIISDNRLWRERNQWCCSCFSVLVEYC